MGRIDEGEYRVSRYGQAQVAILLFVIAAAACSQARRLYLWDLSSQAWPPGWAGPWVRGLGSPAILALACGVAWWLSRRCVKRAAWGAEGVEFVLFFGPPRRDGWIDLVTVRPPLRKWWAEWNAGSGVGLARWAVVTTRDGDRLWIDDAGPGYAGLLAALEAHLPPPAASSW